MTTNRLRLTELDFDNIKSNLKTYLNNQEIFSDYDFEGSGLNILLDILAYNTHYNSYYLNMVANEAFLDSSILRNSVVSHAKSLGYTPISKKAAKAVINFTITDNITSYTSLTLPRGFSFKSNLLDNVSYNFTLLEPQSVNIINNKFYFRDLELYEGTIINYQYVYNNNSNPKSIFVIPDMDIDINSIQVQVQTSINDSSTVTYRLVEDITNVTGTDLVFFIQEGINGKYEIYFGNGSVGNNINDGNVILISYLVTTGSKANKCNIFTVSSSVYDDAGSFTDFDIEVLSNAAGGAEREIINDIKLSSILQYMSQNRMITKNDYEFYITKKYPAVGSLSVWGGEDENPPVFGKVFISIKPKENYYLSNIEKQRIIDEIIEPRNMMSVITEIVDPDYLYIKLVSNIRYNKHNVRFNDMIFKDLVKSSIYNYINNYINRFDSIFAISKLHEELNRLDNDSIGGIDTKIYLEKRFEIDSNRVSSYILNYNIPLNRGTILDGLLSSEFVVYDTNNIKRNMIIEEVPESYTGISEIQIVDSGYGYRKPPIINIIGDGVGASAVATIYNGRITNIDIINRGINYSRAIITITDPDNYGIGGSASAVLNARFGTLRSIYYNSNFEKQIVNNNIGSIDYDLGIVKINDINISSVNSIDGLMRIKIQAKDNTIIGSKNTILTIDETDTNSIITNIIYI